MAANLLDQINKYVGTNHLDFSSVIFTLWFKGYYRELIDMGSSVELDVSSKSNLLAKAAIGCAHIRFGDVSTGETITQNCIENGVDKKLIYGMLKHDFELLKNESLGLTKKYSIEDGELSQPESDSNCVSFELQDSHIEHLKGNEVQLHSPIKYSEKSTFGLNIRYRKSSNSDLKVINQIFESGDYSNDWTPQFKSLKRYYNKLVAVGIKTLIIDGGSNIGVSPLYFNYKFPCADVLAIEPDQDNCDLIRVNCSQRPIYLFQGGLSSGVKVMCLSDPGDGEWAYRLEEINDQNAEAVKCAGVNDFLSLLTFNEHKLLIVKIDIEGGESEFLSNNLEWVAGVALIIIELHDWMLPEYRTSRPIQKLLSKFDFDLCIQGENLFCYNRALLNV